MYIGIDPGQTGGIAVLEDNKATLYKMPVEGGVIDGNGVYKILREHYNSTKIIVIEDVFVPNNCNGKTTYINWGRLINTIELAGLLDKTYVAGSKEWQKEI